LWPIAKNLIPMILNLNNLKHRVSFQPKNRQYTRLLITLIALLTISPLIEDRPGGLLMALGFLLANLLALETIYLPPQLIWLLRIIAGLGFVADIINIPGYARLNDALSLGAYCCYTLFVIGAILVISARIFYAKKVNNDILRGGICIYLLMGILWFLFYRMIEFVASDSFNHLENNIEIQYKLMYFSFTTLTTLGYGDVTPATKISMLLANAEAIIGQMYPAIFIARLVSLYSHEHDDLSRG
jgi:hypothetical protein